jgi:hypothetical protein
MPAYPEIPSTIGTTEGPAQGIGIKDGGTAIPAHGLIIPRPPPEVKGKKKSKKWGKKVFFA